MRTKGCAMRTFMKLATAGAAAVLIIPPASPATAAAPPESRLVTVSHGDPFASCTIGGTPTSTNYLGAEVEPSLAGNPSRPPAVVAAWQQDRWSDGGARCLAGGYARDGGRSFGVAPWPVSRCVPGGLNYERASDPWV